MSGSFAYLLHYNYFVNYIVTYFKLVTLTWQERYFYIVY